MANCRDRATALEYGRRWRQRMPFSITTPGRTRITILVMIATLLVVPALVRATFSSSPTSPIRLNRGFERPPAKCHIPPPPLVVLKTLSLGQAAPPKLDWPAAVLDERSPHALPEGSPDALRGPPILSLA